MGIMLIVLFLGLGYTAVFGRGPTVEVPQRKDRRIKVPKVKINYCKRCGGTGICRMCRGEGCMDCNYSGDCDRCAGTGVV